MNDFKVKFPKLFPGNRREVIFKFTQAESFQLRKIVISAAELLPVTSGGFTSVAAFGTEYPRRGQNEVMEKGRSFYKVSSNCVKPLLSCRLYFFHFALI